MSVASVAASRIQPNGVDSRWPGYCGQSDAGTRTGDDCGLSSKSHRELIVDRECAMLLRRSIDRPFLARSMNVDARQTAAVRFCRPGAPARAGNRPMAQIQGLQDLPRLSKPRRIIPTARRHCRSPSTSGLDRGGDQLVGLAQALGHHAHDLGCEERRLLH